MASPDAEAGGEPAVCSKCGAAVIFDSLDGVSACEGCGLVVEDSELVSYSFELGPNDGPTGALVSGTDGGAAAAARLLPGTGVGLAIQRAAHTQSEVRRRLGAAVALRAAPSGMWAPRAPTPPPAPPPAQAKVRQRLQQAANQLRLPPPVRGQAVHLMERALPAVLGSWRRDYIAAAAAYAACRTNRVPLTLVDLSDAFQVDVHTLGRYYRALLEVRRRRRAATAGGGGGGGSV